MVAVTFYMSRENYLFISEIQKDRKLSTVINEILDEYRTKVQTINSVLYPEVSKQLNEYIAHENEIRKKLQKEPLSAIEFINKAILEKLERERVKDLLG